MFDAQGYRRLISGQTRGFAAAACRAILCLAEFPYALAMRWRNRRYASSPQASQRVGVPVVSVGNLTTGGTGKTPLVAWLARWFRRQNIRVSIVSRGYGAEAGGRNDEALELERLLPDVPHAQNPDRVAAAHLAIEEFATQLIVLDDAFQHRRIHRDLDLVLLDALEPFGYGHVLPRGLLREPLVGLARAHAVLLSRASLVSPERRDEIRRIVARFAPRALWIEGTHEPQVACNWSGEERDLPSLRGVKVAAFCGLGNPEGFRRTLEELGCSLVVWREFPDHHRFTRENIRDLVAAAVAQGAQCFVCTAKDQVKIAADALGDLPLWGLRIGWRFLSGAAQLEEMLHSMVQSLPHDDPPFDSTA